MKKETLRYAKMVHDSYVIPNCKRVREIETIYDVIIMVDDDRKVVEYAMDVFNALKPQNPSVELWCVGGLGMLSSVLNQKGMTEGKAQQIELLQYGVPEERIEVLDSGTNTGENLSDIARQVERWKQKHEREPKILVCLTQRLGLGFYLSLLQQQSMLDEMTSYYIPYQELEEVLELYSGKGLCEGLALWSELASIPDRCWRYSGTLQAPLPFEEDQEMLKAAKWLIKHYPLKIGGFHWRKLPQYLRMRWEIYHRREEIRWDDTRRMKRNLTKYLFAKI